MDLWGFSFHCILSAQCEIWLLWGWSIINFSVGSSWSTVTPPQTEGGDLSFILKSPREVSGGLKWDEAGRYHYHHQSSGKSGALRHGSRPPLPSITAVQHPSSDWSVSQWPINAVGWSRVSCCGPDRGQEREGGGSSDYSGGSRTQFVLIWSYKTRINQRSPAVPDSVRVSRTLVVPLRLGAAEQEEQQELQELQAEEQGETMGVCPPAQRTARFCTGIRFLNRFRVCWKTEY